MPKIIASYLPQFHPILENNKFHSPGFTEWTNVVKATKLFRNHYQPKIPADLGFYDLRLEETRIQQASIAKKYGIHGFCYWHYWFGNGRKVLDLPIREVLRSKKPNFPYCFGWANESWKGIYHGVKSKLLIEQKYPGKEDVKNHFYYVLKYFKDDRYIKINNKPVFLIYKPLENPEMKLFISTWIKLSKINGFDGITFIGQSQFANKEYDILKSLGFDYVNPVRLRNVYSKKSIFDRIFYKYGFKLNVHDYSKIYPQLINEFEKKEDVIPTIIPNWDHSPRSGKYGMIFKNSTPQNFKRHLKHCKEIIKDKSNSIVFLKSWNEWGEGNYVEPDIKYGFGYLEAIKEIFSSK